MNNQETNSNLNKYAQVIVDIAQLDTRTFSYKIPDELIGVLQVGHLVLVPFGTQGIINAYVVGFSNYVPDGIKVKKIYEILDKKPIFDLEYLKFCEWISNYYCCSLTTVLSTALPLKFYSKGKRIIELLSENVELSAVRNKLVINNVTNVLDVLKESKKSLTIKGLQRKANLTPSKLFEVLRLLKRQNIIEIKNVIEEINKKHKTEKLIKLLNKSTDNKRYLSILNLLSSEPMKLTEFLKDAKTTSTTIKKMEELSLVEVSEEKVYRNALGVFSNAEKQEFFQLNQQQMEAFNKIKKAIDNNDTEPLLLYGVTGSGKTEVYIHAMQEVIQHGKTVIFLAPEIPLASQMAKRIVKRFGAEDVVLWHSNMSEGEKFDVWQKIRNNEVKIVVGARSAIFAPVKNLGLIIIDEEHESSYKQTHPTPRYNAKTLAEVRAKNENASLVLGTATPDVSTYYRALNTKRILKLPERFGSSNLATSFVIDLKQEIWKKGFFSAALKQALETNLKEMKQSILLINRRGYSTSYICTNCGHVAECEKCSIPLIVHKPNNSLRCHYCNYEEPAYTNCPECNHTGIKPVGIGTQKVEEAVIKLFPTAKIARIDSDIMNKKNAHIEILEAFSKGDIDILIGTQMIAKGLDNPNVTVVGVISSDSSFTLPDYRSSERGFQLLTQVAGRAGRGDYDGKVYFQTYNPDFFALQNAKEQSYTDFYHAEIQARYEFGYPPFSKIIRLIMSSSNEVQALKFANNLAFKLNEITKSKGLDEKVEVLPPGSCMISKIKNEHRFQIIIKNRLEEKGHSLISNFIKNIKVPEAIKFLIDIDPVDML